MVYLRNIEFLSKYLRVFSKEAFLAAAGWILLMRENYINSVSYTHCSKIEVLEAKIVIFF